jgi:hypothetical protein
MASDTCLTVLSRPLPPRERGGRIDEKDTSHRLLQTDYLERAPNRIGDLPVQTLHALLFAARCQHTVPCGAARQPICLGLPADRSPSKLPRAGARLTTRIELQRLPSTFPLPKADRGSRGMVTAKASRRSRPVVGRFGELSRASCFPPFTHPHPLESFFGLPQAIRESSF